MPDIDVRTWPKLTSPGAGDVARPGEFPEPDQRDLGCPVPPL